MAALDETDTGAPYWQALREGRLDYQACAACGHAWLPARSECPSCLAPAPGWKTASGAATLISWVVYHAAPHPSFAARTPYNVAIVALAEGPRLISTIADAPPDALTIDAPLVLTIGEIDGVAAPQFKLRSGE